MPLGPGTSDITPTMVAPPRLPARIETVARQFDRRVQRLRQHDVLLREVGQRLLSRLEYIKLDPRHVVDVGCGLGRSRQDLLKMYRDAAWTGVDLSAQMTHAGAADQRAAFGLARLWRDRPRWVVADGEQLPFADGSV